MRGWVPASALLVLFPLAATTLLVLLAVAALPSLLLQPDPRFLPEPAAGPGDELALARSQQGTWILNGAPLAEQGLARLLQAQHRGAGGIRFQPSAGLTSGEVAASLAWLRRHTQLPVALASPGEWR